MKKSNLLTALSCVMVLSNAAYADSLDTLLNDVNKRISIVEKTGDCIIPANSNSMSECEPVIAKCPAGTVFVPKPLSRCSITNTDGKEVPDYYSGMGFVYERSNSENGQQECNIGYLSGEYKIKSIAACAKIPKAVPGILKRFGTSL